MTSVRQSADELNTFVDVEDATAAESAHEYDRKAQETPEVLGKLAGVQLAHKDMFARAGRRAGFGSPECGTAPSVLTSKAVTSLRAEGAIELGRLSMSEFAMSPTGFNAHYGRVLNPWSKAHVSGGSSSGSAAAVAAMQVYGSLGSDTAGSIRVPAAMCGVVGLKPTLGAVDTLGAFSLAPSLDVIGPIARTVADCQTLFDVVAGRHQSTGHLRRKIGVPVGYYFENCDARVLRSVDTLLQVLVNAGWECVDVDTDDHAYCAMSAAMIFAREAALSLWRVLDAASPDVGTQVLARLRAGLQVPAADYHAVLDERGRHRQEFMHKLADADVLITPVLPCRVPAIKNVADSDASADAAALARFSLFTRPASYLGLPALTMPIGLDQAGLPVGIQLVGRPNEEWRIFKVAEDIEMQLGVFPVPSGGAQPTPGFT
ncbi:amidase [Aminobacter sp. MSH1]|uniref:amidase n=1 Tax=Aminobacter sp. MSH1 TaxID=374606 RepID=UPI00131F1826|nr:amidase [Aminobacter sp. MSH1]